MYQRIPNRNIRQIRVPLRLDLGKLAPPPSLNLSYTQHNNTHSLPLKQAQSIVFGAIVSATDPVAVVAVLKELGASEKLGVALKT